MNKKYKIVIIEDDNILLNNLKTLLEEENYEVYISENGKAGVKLAVKIIPDLILCDIMMPGFDGFEVKKQLNKNPDTFDIPLIFLTAKTELQSLRKGMELGAEDYIFKPYRAQNLLKNLKLRIEKKQKLVAKIVNNQSAGAKEIDDTFIVTIGNQSKLLKANSIMAITAKSQYSDILTNHGKEIIVRKSLKDWENKLDNNKFYRIHRSTIINFDFIDKIVRSKKGECKLYLKDYSNPFSVSRRFYHELKEKFKM